MAGVLVTTGGWPDDREVPSGQLIWLATMWGCSRASTTAPSGGGAWASLLEVVALTADAVRRLRGYSGGMRRRVGIAQALLADPRLLIVDEPTAGLDPEERIRFRTLLSQLAGERTLLLSTHIVDDLAQTCRELAVLAKGPRWVSSWVAWPG